MKRKIIILLAAGLAVAAFIVAALVFNGVVLLNAPWVSTYPVRGVDVSSYQGEINWPVLAKENIDFAFIKATEGSSHLDPYFTVNYQEALKTNLRVGAYHFFSYDSPDKTQGENFIAAVYPAPNMLPPVVDVEFYGDKEKNPPEAAQVKRELTLLLNDLEAHYGRKPIIYATEKSYRLYIQGRFDHYDLWIRSVYHPPNLPQNTHWTFWQYTNRAKLNGYSGKERFIDVNVFNGKEEAFRHYPKTVKQRE